MAEMLVMLEVRPLEPIQLTHFPVRISLVQAGSLPLGRTFPPFP